MVSVGTAIPAGGTWLLESTYVGSVEIWLCVVVGNVEDC